MKTSVAVPAPAVAQLRVHAGAVAERRGLGGWDHVARLVNALKDRPDDFVAFPAPPAPRVAGTCRCSQGSRSRDGARTPAGAEQLIRYMTRAAAAGDDARAQSGFFPVVGRPAAERARRRASELEADAVAKQASGRRRASRRSLPIGLGTEGGDFTRSTWTRSADRDQRARKSQQVARTSRRRSSRASWTRPARLLGARPAERRAVQGEVALGEADRPMAAVAAAGDARRRLRRSGGSALLRCSSRRSPSSASSSPGRWSRRSSWPSRQRGAWSLAPFRTDGERPQLRGGALATRSLLVVVIVPIQFAAGARDGAARQRRLHGAGLFLYIFGAARSRSPTWRAGHRLACDLHRRGYLNPCSRSSG